MHNLIKLLGFYICIPIYTTIPKIYEIFYYLASARFFTDDTIKSLSSNLYTLVSVVMLFAFSATALASIVNPDLIEDKKKGIGAVFKRGIIGIVLIAAIPFAFNKAYEYQEKIIQEHVIEQSLVGMKFNKDNTPGGNGGKVIAGSLISSVIYPNVEDENDVLEIETTVGSDPQTAYSNMVNDISTMSAFADHLNDPPKDGSKEYAFEFNGIIAIIAGLVADYILLIFAMDMAVRVFKLAFFELTAPVSVIAYIATGADSLKKWASEVGKTYLDVFIRIAAMAFYLFLISKLNEFANSNIWSDAGFTGLGWVLLKLLLIIGMLIFIKQLPDLIKKIFGFDLGSSKGGIKGRLESMAGVGKIASNAWTKVRNPLTAAAGVGSMALGTGAHIAGSFRAAQKSGKEVSDRMRANGTNRFLAGAAGVGLGALQGTAGVILRTPGSAIRSLRNGVNNRNLHSLHDEYKLEMDTHKPGSGTIGRTIDAIREGAGFQTRDQSSGKSVEKLRKAQEALLNISQAAQQVVMSEHNTAHLTLNDGVNNQGNMRAQGNMAQLREYIETFRNSAPVASNYATRDEYNRALTDHQTEMIQLERNYQKLMNDQLRRTMDDANTNDPRTGLPNLVQHLDQNNAEAVELTQRVYATVNQNVTDYNANREGMTKLATNGNIADTIYDGPNGNDGVLQQSYERITNETQYRDPRTGQLTNRGRAHVDQQSRDAARNNNNNNNNNNNK